METIAAISTAQGIGGIGVIRISGSKSKEIVDKIFRSFSGKKLSGLNGYTALYGKVYEDFEIIDETIVLNFNSPHSYTGEDVVEIHCHGGLYITKRVLRVVFSAGAVPAEPGEFTKRAFLNGKLDLTKAESVMNVIKSKGLQSSRVATSAREGKLYAKIEQIKQKILNVTSHLCAWADYPDEDIEEITKESLINSISGIIKHLESLLSTYDSGKVIMNGIDATIVGKPNVGKSTLMNLLSGSDRSIVTDIPGTTRDTIEETIVLDDIVLNLCDTAGIRDTDDPIETIGVDKAKKKMENSSLVLIIFDGSKVLDENDEFLLRNINGLQAIAIINKSDLPQNIDENYIKKFVTDIVNISAVSGDGIKNLIEVISKVVGLSDFDPSEAILTTERQYNAINKALEHAVEARNAVVSNITLDAITVLLESAVQEILFLTGEKASEKIIDEVFSRFCLGK